MIPKKVIFFKIFFLNLQEGRWLAARLGAVKSLRIAKCQSDLETLCTAYATAMDVSRMMGDLDECSRYLKNS